MIMKLAWMDKGITVGNALIDSQHEAIVRDVRGLFSLIELGDIAAFNAEIDAFIYRINVHFNDEEGIFSETDYPRTSEHKIEHKVLRHMAEHIRKSMATSRDPQYLRISLHYFVEALYEHTMNLDKSYIGFV